MNTLYTTNLVFGYMKLPGINTTKNVISLKIVDNILTVEYFDQLLSDTIDEAKIKQIESKQGFFVAHLKEGKPIDNIVSLFPNQTHKGKVTISYFIKSVKEFPGVTKFFRHSNGNIFIEFVNKMDIDFRSNYLPPK